MAVYSEQHKYIFFANPNTASKAIAKTLREKLDGRRIPDSKSKADALKDGGRFHHASYTQLVRQGLMTEEQLKGLLKFTCVRNPFDLMVSKFVKHCERLENKPEDYPWFKRAVKEKNPLLSTAEEGAEIPLKTQFQLWLAHSEARYEKVQKLESGPLDFIRHADVVMRFETLKADFEGVQRRLGIAQPVEIDEFNVTPGRSTAGKTKKPYQDYYNRDSIDIVTRMYKPVLTKFKYRFEAL